MENGKRKNRNGRKRVFSLLLCFVLLFGVCTVGSSAYLEKTAYFVFTVGQEAIAGCKDGTSVLDRYLELLETRNDRIRVPICLDASGLLYDPDFVCALLKLKVAGYDCLMTAKDTEMAEEALSYVRHITKTGVALWLDEDNTLSDSPLLLTVSCRHRTNTFSEFRRLITEPSELIAMDMTVENYYALQLVLNFCQSDGYRPAGLYGLLKHDMRKEQ